jgi:predicted nucleotidyltransferase
MNVTGFKNALNDTILVHLADQLDVRFVSLPGMAVLKLIAWQERHNEFPTKDAPDIAPLLRYYSEAGNDERLYGQHADLIQAADFDFEMAGARMLGRDMAAIMTAQTKETVLKILDVHTNPDGNDHLILAISRCIPGRDYEKSLNLLQNLKKGILDLYNMA